MFVFSPDSPHTTIAIGWFVWEDGDTLIRKNFVEEQNLWTSDLGHDPAEGVAPVELSDQGAGGEGGEDGRYVREEVERILIYQFIDLFTQIYVSRVRPVIRESITWEAANNAVALWPVRPRARPGTSIAWD